MNRRAFLRLATFALAASFADGLHPRAFQTAVMALALVGWDVPMSVPFAVGAGTLIPPPTDAPTTTPAPTHDTYLPVIHA